MFFAALGATNVPSRTRMLLQCLRLGLSHHVRGPSRDALPLTGVNPGK
jgi:hypothetical protein